MGYYNACCDACFSCTSKIMYEKICSYVLCVATLTLPPCTQGEVMYNGHRMEGDVRESFVANTGYVLQLATPYYEELTVRDNLTLAAEMKLDGFTREKKFKRVNDVMEKVRFHEPSALPTLYNI